MIDHTKVLADFWIDPDHILDLRSERTFYIVLSLDDTLCIGAAILGIFHSLGGST